MNRLWARLTRPWREAAAIIAEEQAPTWAKPPAREIADSPVPSAPGPPWDPALPALPVRHGGRRKTIVVWEDGRVDTTDHRTGTTETKTGFCPACAAGADWDRDIRELLS